MGKIKLFLPTLLYERGNINRIGRTIFYKCSINYSFKNRSAPCERLIKKDLKFNKKLL